ncbi:MAG: hypothetical protein O9340_12040 [Cyclobacteriaceae bacterium]|jgi:hypothetical protein|nr:hypothetical protein [Cyclobacteriaceae bacterium]
MKKPLTIRIADKHDITKLPKKYLGVIGQKQIGRTLIILDGDKEDVLTSKEIEKVLKKIKFKDGIHYSLLLPNVTIEAEKVIATLGHELIRLDNFYWTDYSYSQREQRWHELKVERKQQLFEEKQKSEK